MATKTWTGVNETIWWRVTSAVAALGLAVAAVGAEPAARAAPAGPPAPTPQPKPQLAYALNDLGAGSPYWSFGNAINNSGQAAIDIPQGNGYVTAANQGLSTANSIGALPSNSYSNAYAINSGGAVAGSSTSATMEQAVRFGVGGAGMEDLHPGNPPPNYMTGTSVEYTQSAAYGINDAGVAAGWVHETVFDQSHRVISSYDLAMLSRGPGQTTLLTSLGISTAMDVNNNSQVTGWHLTNFQLHAFLMDAGSGTFIDIGPLSGGIYSSGFGLNDLGQVVGEAQTASGWDHAFVFQDANGNGVAEPAEIVDLGAAYNGPSRANAINSHGVAVGHVGDPTAVYGNSRACMFTRTGQLIDLNTLIYHFSGWILRDATGINDAGQIVGFMEDMNVDNQARVRHAFRIDPPGLRTPAP